MLNRFFSALTPFRVFIICLGLIAVVSNIKPMGHNDQSRYLSIMALVNNQSFVIDESIKNFGDTIDKVYIQGHFYTDKPPLFSMVYSSVFFLGKSIGIRSDHPYLYKFAIFIFSGIPFALAMFLFFKEYVFKNSKNYYWLGLLLIFATPYYVFSRVMMSHAVVGSLLYIGWYFLRHSKNTAILFSMGILWGLAISFDLGAMFMALGLLLYLAIKNPKTLLPVTGGMALPLMLYAYLLWQLTQAFIPVNMHPEYFNYPGSVWLGDNTLTGSWKHSSIIQVLNYLVALFIFSPLGQLQSKGLFLSCPILFYGVKEFMIRIKNSIPTSKSLEEVCILTGISLVVGYYLIFSNNLGGGDYTIRWFIIFIPFCLPMIYSFYTKQHQSGKSLKLFHFFLFFSLLISTLYSGLSWLEPRFTPFF
jgi:hypothetical protein